MGIQINGNTNNINAGIGSLSIEDLNELDIVGVATASNFKTGSSNLHSTGLTVGNALVHSTGINVGTGATVHSPATNILTFGTNSNERVRITSTGAVGIGTDTPNGDLQIRAGQNANFRVLEDPSTSGLFVGNYGSGDGYRSLSLLGSNILFHTITAGALSGAEERLRIDSAGNVGVGTNVASDSTGNCQAFKIARPLNGQLRLILQNSATGFGNGAGFHQGIDGSGVFIENRSNGGSIDFATFDSGGSYGMRFRITSDGTIGINETSPNSVLHVKNHNNNTADITIEGGGSGNAGIQFIPGGQTNSYFAYVDTNRNFRIQDHTSEKLRLVSGGNFAIGNTHGAKKIHISTYGNQKILIDPNYNNNSGGSSNSEANANNVVDSVLIRSSFGDNAASQTNAGHKWGIKFQGYNGNDFTQNTAKIAAVYAVSEDEATGYNKNVGLAFHTSPYNTTHREAMRINTNGAVTKPYHPAFAARLSSGTIDLTTAGGSDMVFNLQEFDNSGSYDTTNGRFTAPVAGKYYFGVQLYAGFNGTGVRVLHAHFRVNGTSVAQTDMFGGASNHGGTHYHPTAVGHMFRNLNKNDYVTFNLGGFSHSGGQAILYASTGNRFFGHLVC